MRRVAGLLTCIAVLGLCGWASAAEVELEGRQGQSVYVEVPAAVAENPEAVARLQEALDDKLQGAEASAVDEVEDLARDLGEDMKTPEP